MLPVYCSVACGDQAHCASCSFLCDTLTPQQLELCLAEASKAAAVLLTVKLIYLLTPSLLQLLLLVVVVMSLEASKPAPCYNQWG